MQLEAAVVHVHGPHERRFPVRQHGFPVQQPRGEPIDLHAVVQQLPEIALRHHKGELVVRDAGHHQPHVHAAAGGHAQGLLHGLVNGQIRRGDVHHVLGPADQLQKRVLGRGHRVAVRPVRDGLHKALPRRGALGPVIVMLLLQGAAHALPHIDELPGQSPAGLALQPDAIILPIAEPLGDVGVLVGDIGPAGIGGVPVDAGDLPVVPIVEVQPVHIVVHRVEDQHLRPNAPQLLHGLLRHAHHAAEVVEQHLDLHALSGLPPENIHQPVPQLPLGHDVKLHENEVLRLLHALQHVLQIRLAGGQIHGPGAGVQGEALPVQIRRQASPLRVLPPQLLHLEAAGLPPGLGFLGPGQLFQVQPLLGMVPVPQPVQDQPHHRHRQDQQGPAQLIRAAAGAAVDAKDVGQGHQLQQGIGDGHSLPQQVIEHQHQRDLGQQQHRHQHQPQGRRYAPLCLLLHMWFLHRESFLLSRCPRRSSAVYGYLRVSVLRPAEGSELYSLGSPSGRAVGAAD